MTFVFEQWTAAEREFYFSQRTEPNHYDPMRKRPVPCAHADVERRDAITQGGLREGRICRTCGAWLGCIV
jgi:hypothetical protein